MTREEKNEIIQGVIDAIKAQSQDILELPSSDNIEEVKTLLILAKGGVLKSISMDAFNLPLNKAEIYINWRFFNEHLC